MGKLEEAILWETRGSYKTGDKRKQQDWKLEEATRQVTRGSYKMGH